MMWQHCLGPLTIVGSPEAAAGQLRTARTRHSAVGYVAAPQWFRVAAGLTTCF